MEYHGVVAQKTGYGGPADSEIFACLRNLSMHELIGSPMEYSIANQPLTGLFTFISSVDEYFILDHQSNLLRIGEFVKGKSHACALI